MREQYQDKNFKYTDAESYDRRGESSVLENYVLGLWQPFLKEKIKNLSIGNNGRISYLKITLFPLYFTNNFGYI